MSFHWPLSQYILYHMAWFWAHLQRFKCFQKKCHPICICISWRQYSILAVIWLNYFTNWASRFSFKKYWLTGTFYNSFLSHCFVRKNIDAPKQQRRILIDWDANRFDWCLRETWSISIILINNIYMRSIFIHKLFS